MVATTRIRMADIARQKRLDATLDGDELTPHHTVGQVIDHYLQRSRIPDSGLRWSAYSRGVKLDGKQVLQDLPAEDTDWTILPEVSAGTGVRAA